MRNHEAKPSVISLFCGAGGLDLGFHLAGYQILWANDNVTYAVSSYAMNLPLEPVLGDINTIAVDAIPRADVVIGGPPCQAFSLVGLRRGDDSRGKLVFRFLDIVRHLEPEAFVMENVPGMAASRINGIRLPVVLQTAFEKLGYHTVQMKLNACDYLVPQLRRRLFIIGSKRGAVGIPDPDEFAMDNYSIDRSRFDVSAEAAIGDLGEVVERGRLSAYRTPPKSGFAKLMRSSAKKRVSLHERQRLSKTDEILVSHIPPGGNYMDVPDSVAPGRVLRFKETGGRTTTYGRLHPDRPAYTINTYFRRPNVGCNFHYSEERLITPREAMRFQAFPDTFELSYASQDGRNALIGNAVPPLMGQAVAWNIRKSLRTSRAVSRISFAAAA